LAQGKQWDKEKVVEAIKPFFLLGYSIRKACINAGIPESTVKTWLEKDEELRLQIGAWQNMVNSKARKNLIDTIQGVVKDDTGKVIETIPVAQRVATSLDWLKGMEKDAFSTRKELTGADGEPLNSNLTEEEKQALLSLLD
jgi:hypothetical protein